MKYKIIEISDKKRKNTTIKKIKETLSNYDLSKIDKIIFFVKDLYYPPIDLNKWIKGIMDLRWIVYEEAQYKEISVNHLFNPVPEVEIKISKSLKEKIKFS